MFFYLGKLRSTVVGAGTLLVPPPTRRSVCAFSTHAASLEKPLPPRIVVPETDLRESFLKGSGPGGQKINKTSSAVQLKHLPTGIVVKNQETRSREQNRKNARRILSEKLEMLEKGPLSRTALKIEKARKKKASAAKKARRKYRKLEEGEGEEEDAFAAVDSDTDVGAGTGEAKGGKEQGESGRMDNETQFPKT